MNNDEFRLTFEKTGKYHTIYINQYHDGERISQVHINGDNEDFETNHENMTKITDLLNNLMTQTKTYEKELIEMELQENED